MQMMTWVVDDWTDEERRADGKGGWPGKQVYPRGSTSGFGSQSVRFKQVCKKGEDMYVIYLAGNVKGLTHGKSKRELL